jgi:hypothetical protein
MIPATVGHKSGHKWRKPEDISRKGLLSNTGAMVRIAVASHNHLPKTNFRIPMVHIKPRERLNN